MVRWLRWHCPPDTGFEIRALAVWGRARYLSVTEAPHNTNFHTWMGKKQFCFFQTAATGNRTPDSGVKGSGVNHYPRAPAQLHKKAHFVSGNRHFCLHAPLSSYLMCSWLTWFIWLFSYQIRRCFYSNYNGQSFVTFFYDASLIVVYAIAVF